MTPELAEAVRLAVRRHGSPLYLYDLDRLAGDAAAVRAAFPDPWLRLYSLKANGLPAIVRQLGVEGFGASCVSGGEVTLALRAGLPPARVALEGIGKSRADLVRVARLAAAAAPLIWVSIESVEEAAELARLLRRAGAGVRQDVLVRINPAVVPETARGLAVGATDSKFGLLPEELSAVIEAGGGPDGQLRWRGLHLHVGSQLGAVDAWRSAFRLGLRLLELQRARLPDFDTLDPGGGFPVAADTTSVPSAGRFGQEAAAELAGLPAGTRPPARLAVEPGRALVAGSGWLVGRVLHVRTRARPIVVLDAGMTELIRPALYGAVHPIRALTSLGRPVSGPQEGNRVVRVDGPVCESTDTLGAAPLPPLERGDVLAIGLAGAYGSAMASTYNGRPRPPEVAWDGQRLVLWRRRGTLRELP